MTKAVRVVMYIDEPKAERSISAEFCYGVGMEDSVRMYLDNGKEVVYPQELKLIAELYDIVKKFVKTGAVPKTEENA